MDYVVDDVVRRVSSSSRRKRGGGGSGGGGSMTAFEPGVVGAGSGIPSVVEAVLRIGGSAMGPALVRAFLLAGRDVGQGVTHFAEAEVIPPPPMMRGGATFVFTLNVVYIGAGTGGAPDIRRYVGTT